VFGKILFVVALPNGLSQADIHTVNPSGSRLRNLTRHPAYYDPPAVSPDGTRLAFYRSPTDPDDSGDVFLMNADGSDLHQITHSADYENGLTWSPDGQLLALVVNGNIYTMTAEGTDRTSLNPNPDFKANPAWSPDGSHIAYARFTGGLAGYDLALMTSGGQNDTLLLSLEGNDQNPVWDPAGSVLFFVHRDTPYSHLMRLDLTTGDTATLTTGPVIDLFPALSPSGDTLVFVRTDVALPGQPQELQLLLPGAGTPRPVTRFAARKYAYFSTWAGHP
jgi:Tol biopolymer transport system component